jgi:hypothetical protein
MDDEERVGAARAPIRIDCNLPGREGPYAVFKADGWKFKHLRTWENETSVEGLAMIVAERIQRWHILSDYGAEIPFLPDIAINGRMLSGSADAEPDLRPNPAVFDELAPEMNAWLIMAFRQAYREAGRPNPNA